MKCYNFLDNKYWIPHRSYPRSRFHRRRGSRCWCTFRWSSGRCQRGKQGWRTWRAWVPRRWSAPTPGRWRSSRWRRTLWMVVLYNLAAFNALKSFRLAKIKKVPQKKKIVESLAVLSVLHKVMKCVNDQAYWELNQPGVHRQLTRCWSGARCKPGDPASMNCPPDRLKILRPILPWNCFAEKIQLTLNHCHTCN